MGTFAIPATTVGGGSAWLDAWIQWLQGLSQEKAGRAAVGTDLFSQLLGASLEANRRPVSLVDQLMLGGKYGSAHPLSQLGSEGLSRFGYKENPMLGNLASALGIYSQGMNTAQQQGHAGINPNTGLPWTAQESAYMKARAANAAQPPVNMAHGGTFRVDPRRKATARTATNVQAAAGPVTMYDAMGEQIAKAGEGQGSETVTVTPQPQKGPPTLGAGGSVGDTARFLRDVVQPVVGQFGQTIDGDPVTAGDIASATRGYGQNAPPATAPTGDVVFSAAEKFRYDELLRQGFTPEQARTVAKRPGDFLNMYGKGATPQQQASWLLAESTAHDLRYSEPFRRALALGQRPAPGTGSTMRDVSQLSPDQLGSLQSILGPDLFTQYLFELQSMTPRGVSTRPSTIGSLRL
jgi:hypothetical protein